MLIHCEYNQKKQGLGCTSSDCLLSPVQSPVFALSANSPSLPPGVHASPFQKDLWDLKLTAGKQIVHLHILLAES